ncbi:MAG TPA: calcium-binding protein [Solirubrobacterales bacterium]|nr:calcium-binding protein [Solirubrobacterales bacterium]
MLRAAAGGRRAGLALAAVVLASFALMLVFADSPDALQALCGGRHGTIASNDRVIHGTRGPDVILGGPGPNRIYGARGNDTICGGPGRDRIEGGKGKDTIDGKTGRDYVRGGRGSDELDGGAGRDRVRGDSGNDTARGGPERDDVEGGLGDDAVDGGRGSFDTLSGGIGSDRIDGGPGGHDIVSYRSAGGPIEVDLASGSVSGAEEEHLVAVEDVVGGSGDDLLATSDATANRVEGGPGDDRLLGSHSEDEAFGGPGSDECFGSFSVVESCGAASGAGTRVELYDSLTGAATLAIAGDAGVDEISVGFRQGRFLVSAEAGNPVRLGDPRYARDCGLEGSTAFCADQVSSILVSLGPGADLVDLERSLPPGIAVTVDGGPGSDWLLGGPGGDTLYAGDDADPDRLEGGGGDDALFGVNILHPRRGSGAAAMFGGGGDDLLIGGQPCEGDVFRGGPGATDSASFARVRNEGIYVEARIGGEVLDPEAGECAPGWIARSTEKIEGSTGPDRLTGSAGPNTLLGRGGGDELDGRGGPDRCIGGRGGDRARHCEYLRN